MFTFYVKNLLTVIFSSDNFFLSFVASADYLAKWAPFLSRPYKDAGDQVRDDD